MTDETPSAELEILDPDLHVATFFVPAARRSSVEGLMLFALELERIATQVSEPMVAQIRYAWWREQVDAVFGGRGVAAPVAVRLREAVAEHGLPRAPLDAMVDAHSLDCDPAPFGDMVGFEAYCRDTQGSLMRLVARVLGAGAEADAACDLAGLAVGAGVQLRSFEYWRRHRRLRLPVDALVKAGVNEEDVFAGQADGAVAASQAVVQKRILQALADLNQTRFPRAAMPMLALASLARPIAAPGFDLRAPRSVSAVGRVTRLALANFLWRV